MAKIVERLKALREQMIKEGVEAWYISGTDPHSSEYLTEHWKTRAFISGFTGSYGIVVLTRARAALWTDSRYFLQAADELEGSGIELMKLRVPGTPTPGEWLAGQLGEGEKVGVDTRTLSVTAFRDLASSLQPASVQLIETPDLLDRIWTDRPALPHAPIFELAVEYAGVNRREKINRMQEELKRTGVDLMIVSMLDELAWLFNLRGSDIRYNPVFIAYAVVGHDEVNLFINPEKLSEELKLVLQSDGVKIRAYDDFFDYLMTLRQQRVLLDPASSNYRIYNVLFENNEVVEVGSPIAFMKARKNEVEVRGIRQAMIKDGVALVKFLHWLRKSLGKEQISEYDVAQKLRDFRAQEDGFFDESFAPIVGYREHGAIVHLSVRPDNAKTLQAQGILLFDSGGQYPEGTTDITRTVALGQVSEQEKIDFTLVLKGMIALSMAKFPKGTKGCQLDILARQFLWQAGLNYGHGTGHGVGHFLNVHEGPVSIRQEYNKYAIEPGHVLSNEPGLYRSGLYGIRVENLVLCVESESGEFGEFLRFETLTLCPIDTTLINLELFSREERAWLNAYHREVYARLSPYLNKEQKHFLNELTRPV